MPIYFISSEKRFVLESRQMAYCFEIEEGGHIRHLYWGAKFARKQDYEQLDAVVIHHSSAGFESPRGVMGYEFIPWGEMVYSDPTLKLHDTDHHRGLSLVFQSHTIETHEHGDILKVKLTDERLKLMVILEYTLFTDFDVLGRKLSVRNQGNKTLKLEIARSLHTSLPWGKHYRFTHLKGKWTGEFHIEQEPIKQGRKTIESRRGTTSHQANPWFAIDHRANEDRGEVWYGHLAYSGNWEINVERDDFGFTHISGGAHSFDFVWHLEPSDSFQTPDFFIGFTNEGFQGMSAKSHRFQREVILPSAHAGSLRKVLYNSWEATKFDVNEQDQMALAEKAAQIGCEMFVIDDGWFGQRYTDAQGLGDWYVNKDKFPNGLTPLIDRVHDLNMSFGIWVEPEMTNSESDLYRRHPDWVYHFPGQKMTTARNQLVLNLARKEVREYILSFMDDLLTYNEIDFVKWDMNRNFSEVGDPQLGSRQNEIWFRHIQSLYHIIDVLRERHPYVIFESCAGGGGRVDLGILQRTDQVWPSDNTDAYDRLWIQEGFSHAYLPKAMMCWVTDSASWCNDRKLPLEYRFHSAMTGSLGIGGDLNKWSSDELESAKQYIALYKQMRPIIQEGTQYRLSSFRHGPVMAIQYISPDEREVIVFCFQGPIKHGQRDVRIRLAGLDDQAIYVLKGREKTATGSFFKQHGILWRIEHDYDSQIFHLQLKE